MRTHFFVIYLFVALSLFASSILLTQHYFYQEEINKEKQFIKNVETSIISADDVKNNAGDEPEYLPHSFFLKPTHTVNFAYLNVRSEPTIYSSSLKKIYNGEKVVLFKRINRDWCQVEIPRFETQGYVACRYLRAIP